VVLLALALDPLRGRIGALVVFGALAVYIVGSQVIFVRTGAVLSAVYPALAIVFTYLAISAEHYAVADREKRHTRRMLDLYLSPSLANYVSDRPETLKLGGEKSDRTVLFSDIKSFTSMAEGMEPEDLVELLNVYLGAMTDIVFAHDGMLDKYIGDGVMGVWGAPIAQPDHAARACQAALAMIDRLGELNAEWAERGWPTLRIRIGMNSGPMVFGNIGSSGHLSLTVMGDNVNLGARLEGVNKLYGTAIIASEATLNLARELVVARELDLVRVKGKANTSRIFEILGPAGSAGRWAELIHFFTAGLAAYRAREWEAAIAAFEKALTVRGDDGPSDLHLRRCRDHPRDRLRLSGNRSPPSAKRDTAGAGRDRHAGERCSPSWCASARSSLPRRSRGAARQLPRDVRPTHYALELTVVPSAERFSGLVRIDIVLDGRGDRFWLHGNELDVSEIAVETEAGEIGARWEQVDRSGVVAVTPAQPIGPGTITLRVRWSAPLDRQLRALFRVDVGENSYAFTQFEPVLARRAFPCFDEPVFKTPFDLTLIVPRAAAALANAPQTSRDHISEQLDRPRALRHDGTPADLPRRLCGRAARRRRCAAAGSQRPSPNPAAVARRRHPRQRFAPGVRPEPHAAAVPGAGGVLRHPVSVRQARPDRRAGHGLGRHGECRRDHVS
jgi:class 3 adenylate cyclase